ncbi:unnamed protein product [Blepharisma stoltei]|uniref:Uncharacterized protein n=1 Tax=Blepharisma stoltei TaxID=1481888 RepID=A0AAU9KBA4_9CILI|nr:unnamed protein product [Blepharisma stoltei]
MQCAQTLQGIWESTLHSLGEWEQQMMKGKLILEMQAQGLEEVLEKLSDIIIKLKWFLYTVETQIFIRDEARSWVIMIELKKIIEMMSQEWDLKVSLSQQATGLLEKRKMVAYTWVTEPYMDESYLAALPKKFF